MLGIYTLYEEIVKSNQSVYGTQVLKQFQAFKKATAMNAMFQFKAIVREKELDAFCNLCFAADYRPDLNNVSQDVVSKVLSVQLPKAPLHKQVQKVAIMKQYAGMFSGWRDATVILTRDLYLHVYPFSDQKAYSKLINLTMSSTDH